MRNTVCGQYSQPVGYHFTCAWYCHTGPSMEGWKLAKKRSHGNTAGPFILHSTISKNVLNDFGLVQAKQHDKEVALLSFESLGQHG